MIVMLHIDYQQTHPSIRDFVNRMCTCVNKKQKKQISRKGMCGGPEKIK